MVVGSFVTPSFGQSVGLLIPVGQRLGQLVARLISPLTGFSVDSSACWSVSFLIGHSFIIRMVSPSVGWSVPRRSLSHSVGLSVDVFVPWSVCWSLDQSFGPRLACYTFCWSFVVPSVSVGPSVSWALDQFLVSLWVP